MTSSSRRRNPHGMRPGRVVVAVFLAAILILAVIAAVEYERIQSLDGQLSSGETQAEVVYNLPGVAIPVICCPDLASSIVVGSYLLTDSSITPYSSFIVNGTTYPGANGVMLFFKVSPLSSPDDVQNASFVWSDTFNGSAPFPTYSSIFGGSVDFHWYVLDGLLFMHVQTS